MNESEFQREFMKFVPTFRPTSVFAPHVELKYEVGKYGRGKAFGLPDTVPDVIEFDAYEQFHLWELKMIDAPELWSGKFFGQIMLYNFLFETESWSELLGRFAICADRKDDFVGDVGRVLTHLVGYGDGKSEAQEGDPKARFSSWNLCVCGGDGYELAAGVNPVIWSYWVIADEYFVKSRVPPLRVWHFFETSIGYEIRDMSTMTVLEPGSLHPEAFKAFETSEIQL
jgi:hypothetical protein